MIEKDIHMLTDDETTVVDNSFDRAGLPTRFRNIMLGAFLAIGSVLALLVLNVSTTLMAAAAIFIVLVASLEKVTYVRTLMNARAAIRKLVRRVERLEGVPPTPENGKPSRSAVTMT